MSHKNIGKLLILINPQVFFHFNLLFFTYQAPGPKKKNSKEKPGKHSAEKHSKERHSAEKKTPPPPLTKPTTLTPIKATNQTQTTTKATSPTQNATKTTSPTTTPISTTGQAFCSCSPCLNGGTCIDLIGGLGDFAAPFKCECSQGFYGPFCENVLTTPSPLVTTGSSFCSCSPCLNGGTCIDLIGGLGDFTAPFKCECSQGFDGSFCENALPSKPLFH